MNNWPKHQIPNVTKSHIVDPCASKLVCNKNQKCVRQGNLAFCEIVPAPSPGTTCSKNFCKDIRQYCTMIDGKPICKSHVCKLI